MDLLAMDRAYRLKKANLTVLSKDESWTVRDIDTLKGGLQALVHLHTEHPKFLVLEGEFSRMDITALIGTEYQYRVVQGFKNPELPFPLCINL